MVNARPIAASAGLLVDHFLGEPPAAVHPVAAFGSLMGRVEARIWADSRRAGTAYALIGAAVGAGAGGLLSRAGGPGTTGAVAAAAAGRLLRRSALEVGRALEAGRLEEARALVGGLVGRDTAALDGAGVARAAVETVAENTVDAVVAPALWAAVAGATGALGYRAVNTMDAMVGHRSPRHHRFGWAAARTDDVANWVPARLTALLVVAARPGRGRPVWEAVRRQAPLHPSPNAGVAEAAFAAALGLRLGGTNEYGGRVDHRPALGDGRPPVAADVGAACRLSRDVTALLAAGLGVAGAVAGATAYHGGADQGTR